MVVIIFHLYFSQIDVNVGPDIHRAKWEASVVREKELAELEYPAPPSSAQSNLCWVVVIMFKITLYRKKKLI